MHNWSMFKYKEKGETLLIMSFQPYNRGIKLHNYMNTRHTSNIRYLCNTITGIPYQDQVARK